MRVERFKVDPNQYYDDMESEIISGIPTWVSNLEVDGSEKWHGFFHQGELKALVRIQENLSSSIKRYPVIYLMKDGKAQISATAFDVDDAVEKVESRLVPERVHF
jgi:hypothetical protein